MAVQAEGSSRDPVTVRPGDPRYADLAGRGSGRFAGKPDYVRLVCSTEHVIAAVQDAVRERRRVAVRSGGHCLEAFVADPAVRVVIDTSLMTGVSYDPEMRAFTIESGTRLGEAYRRLFLGWGVTIPAGVSPNVGIGGHVVGRRVRLPVPAVWTGLGPPVRRRGRRRGRHRHRQASDRDP